MTEPDLEFLVAADLAAEPRRTWWVWPVYLGLYALAIPWYWPAGYRGPLVAGLPLWVAVSVGAVLGLAIWTAIVIAVTWKDRGDAAGRVPGRDGGGEGPS
ncbi:MAG: hypothetical protein ABIL09_23885 [Gemmatimonadota bacterium]